MVTISVRGRNRNPKIRKMIIQSAIISLNRTLKISDHSTFLPQNNLKKTMSKVFDRFFQADRSHTKNAEALGGNGLGLSICKAIVESMGGTISVTSTLEKGSTFTITLPLIGPV